MPLRLFFLLFLTFLPFVAAAESWQALLAGPDALTQLEQRLEQNPNPYLEHDLGRLYEEQGQDLKALYHYRRAAASLPFEALPKEAVIRLENKLGVEDRSKGFALNPWVAFGCLLGLATLGALAWGGSFVKHNQSWLYWGRGLIALTCGLGLLWGGLTLLPSSQWQVMEQSELRTGPGNSFALVRSLTAGQRVQGNKQIAGWLQLPEGWVQLSQVKAL